MSAEREKVGCERCKFLLRQDVGYSNYTVEDTEVHCLKRVHPHMDGDRDPYNVESEEFNRLLGYGERCEHRAEGDPMWLDVDGDTLPKDAAADEEALAVYRAWLEEDNAC